MLLTCIQRFPCLSLVLIRPKLRGNVRSGGLTGSPETGPFSHGGVTDDDCGWALSVFTWSILCWRWSSCAICQMIHVAEGAKGGGGGAVGKQGPEKQQALQRAPGGPESHTPGSLQALCSTESISVCVPHTPHAFVLCLSKPAAISPCSLDTWL